MFGLLLRSFRQCTANLFLPRGSHEHQYTISTFKLDPLTRTQQLLCQMLFSFFSSVFLSFFFYYFFCLRERKKRPISFYISPCVKGGKQYLKLYSRTFLHSTSHTTPNLIETPLCQLPRQSVCDCQSKLSLTSTSTYLLFEVHVIRASKLTMILVMYKTNYLQTWTNGTTLYKCDILVLRHLTLGFGFLCMPVQPVLNTKQFNSLIP